MKNLLFCFTLLVISSSSLMAQNSESGTTNTANESSENPNFYSLTNALRVNLSFTYQSTDFGVQARFYSPAVSLQMYRGNRHLHEVGILSTSSLSTFQIADIGRGITGSLNLKYQYNYMLGTGTRKFRPYFGAGVYPSFFYARNDPTTVNNFQTRSSGAVFGFGAVSGLQLNLKSNFFLDVSIPLRFASIQFIQGTVLNPALPIENQIVSFTRTNFFLPEVFIIEIGGGLRF